MKLTDLEARRNKLLGRTIAEYRRKASLSQETLAFECDLHPTYISQIERGLKSLTVRTLYRIAENVGCRPSRILKDVEKQSP